MSLFSPSSLFFILVLSNSFIPFTSSLNEEVLALLSFKNSINQDPSTAFQTWNFSNPNPCSWNGITCKDFKVISLSIPKSNLYGSISPSLFSLPSLRHINLRNNRLYGSLPSTLNNSSGLQSLVLYGNLLSGPLPFDIGKLSYLQILDLSNNFFNGSIPNSIVRCKRLKTLDLSHNNFTGSLPTGFGSSLVQLEKLALSYNRFNGSIPADIGRTGTVAFQPLSWDMRLKIMKGIAKGLSHLHEVSPKKYVHGDLKPNNILLGLKMEPYISNFGVSHLANIAGGSPLLQSDRIDVTQSPMISIASCYQAPEALKTLKPSQKWDIYSYGVILLELISGRSPIVLMETSEMDLVRWVQLCIEEKKPLSDVLDPFLSHELDRKEDEIIPVLKIALTCVQANPERRPSMKNVVDTLERLVNAS